MEWKVQVSGEPGEEVRAALAEAGIKITTEAVQGTIEEDDDEGFVVSLDAGTAAAARQRVETVLSPIDGYSAGAASR